MNFLLPGNISTAQLAALGFAVERDSSGAWCWFLVNPESGEDLGLGVGSAGESGFASEQSAWADAARYRTWELSLW